MARTKASKFCIPCTVNVPERFFDALARALSSVQLSLYFYKLFFIILFYKFQKVTGLKAWGEASNSYHKFVRTLSIVDVRRADFKGSRAPSRASVFLKVDALVRVISPVHFIYIIYIINNFIYENIILYIFIIL